MSLSVFGDMTPQEKKIFRDRFPDTFYAVIKKGEQLLAEWEALEKYDQRIEKDALKVIKYLKSMPNADKPYLPRDVIRETVGKMVATKLIFLLTDYIGAPTVSLEENSQ